MTVVSFCTLFQFQLILYSYHTFKSSRVNEEDSICIRNKDGRILVQGERSDLETHYCKLVYVDQT